MINRVDDEKISREFANPSVPAARNSKFKTVLRHYDEIERAVQNGYSYQQITDILKSGGLDISVKLLTDYLHLIRKRKSKATPKKNAASAVQDAVQGSGISASSSSVDDAPSIEKRPYSMEEIDEMNDQYFKPSQKNSVALRIAEREKQRRKSRDTDPS